MCYVNLFESYEKFRYHVLDTELLVLYLRRIHKDDEHETLSYIT